MKKEIATRFCSRAGLISTLVIWTVIYSNPTLGQGSEKLRGTASATLGSDSSSKTALEEEKISGFRIQVYQGSSRVKAKEIRDIAVLQYSKLGVYMGFRQPDFRVRLGDFRDRGEAQAYLQMLKGEFPAAFVVPDKVLLYPKASEEGSPTLDQDGFED